jgi:magnesium-transporting ATPase (P-type)
MKKGARMLTVDGDVLLVPRHELSAGQRVRALAGEAVAVDARVVGGAALVDEAAVHGTRAPARRVMGDQVFAGSRLIAGALDLEVVRSGDQTQAARIAQRRRYSMVAHTTPGTPQYESLVGGLSQTLQGKGAGLFIGDLSTAGAILRPDYATGVGLAAALETLHDVKLAIRNGAVICLGDAFLSACDDVVDPSR